MLPLDSLARVQHQNDEAFALRVEVRHGGDMDSPLFGRSPRHFAEVHQLQGWALPKEDHFPLLRLLFPSGFRG